MFDSSFHYGISSFPHRLICLRVCLVVLSVRFVGWALRLVVFTSSTHHRPHLFAILCRFTVSLCRFVVSAQSLSGAIFWLVFHRSLLDSMPSYMTRPSIVRSLPTEDGSFEELPTPQHWIRLESSGWAFSWKWKWNWISSSTHWQTFVYCSTCILVI